MNLESCENEQKLMYGAIRGGWNPLGAVNAAAPKANDVQEGGTHYKDMGIQPWEAMEAVLTREEFIGFLKGNVIKYAMRQGKKDSPDAAKARHYAQKLKEVLDGR